VQFRRGDDVAGERQVAGRAGVGGDRHGVAPLDSGAHRRRHAIVGHEAGKHDRSARVADPLFEVGPGEGAGEGFLDHRLAFGGLQRVDEIAALLRPVEEIVRRAPVGRNALRGVGIATGRPSS
jgi:hypothetical protein